MIIALGGMDDLGMRDCMVRYLGRIEPQVLGTENIEGKGFIGCGRVLQAGHCQECELGMSPKKYRRYGCYSWQLTIPGFPVVQSVGFRVWHAWVQFQGLLLLS